MFSFYAAYRKVGGFFMQQNKNWNIAFSDNFTSESFLYTMN